jgi:hypothetical protein
MKAQRTVCWVRSSAEGKVSLSLSLINMWFASQRQMKGALMAREQDAERAPLIRMKTNSNRSHGDGECRRKVL